MQSIVQKSSLRSAGLIGGALATLLVAACGTTGSDGNLRFKDTSAHHNGDLRPIAAGYTTTYEVSRATWNAKVTLEQGSSSNEAAAVVSGVTGATVKVRGVAAGSSEIEVITTNDVRDRINVDVREPTSARYAVTSMESNKETTWTEMGSDSKINLLPGVAFDLKHFAFEDTAGTVLSGGVDAIPVGTPAATGSSKAVVRNDGYTIALTAGAVGDTITIPSGFGNKSMSVAVTETVDAKSIRARAGVWLTSAPITVKGNTITVRGTTAATLAFDVADAAGHVYVGEFPLAATLTVGAGDAFTISPEDGACAADQDPNDCRVYEGVNRPRMGFLSSKVDKETKQTLTVAVGEHSQTFEVVLLPVADETPDE